MVERVCGEKNGTDLLKLGEKTFNFNARDLDRSGVDINTFKLVNSYLINFSSINSSGGLSTG